MNFKRLRYAIALAEELNFARAAERVHLSQPALSRSIQALEQSLGLQLFDRDNRNVSLTRVGAVFIEQARRLQLQLRNMERDMGMIRDGEVGRVAFGIGSLPSADLLPQLVPALRQSRPGLSLAISSNNWRILLNQLRAEEIEFFVADTRSLGAEHDLVITPLCRQYAQLYCRPGHPLLASPGWRREDLLSYGFAAALLPAALSAQLHAALQLAPDAPLPMALECDNIAILKHLVCSDDAVLLSTTCSVAAELATGQLRPLPWPDMPQAYGEYGIVELAGRSQSPAAVQVLAQLVEIVDRSPATAVYRDGQYRPPA